MLPPRSVPRLPLRHGGVAEKKPRKPLTVGGHAVGRRKQAIARVRLVPGKGSYTVNGRTLEDISQTSFTSS